VALDLEEVLTALLCEAGCFEVVNLFNCQLYPVACFAAVIPKGVETPCSPIVRLYVPLLVPPENPVVAVVCINNNLALGEHAIERVGSVAAILGIQRYLHALEQVRELLAHAATSTGSTEHGMMMALAPA